MDAINQALQWSPYARIGDVYNAEYLAFGALSGKSKRMSYDC
jgi:hypothetical protein